MRILYYYPFQHCDSGSPKALISVIGSLDRSLFEPLFLATSDGPLVSELERLGVNILHGCVDSVSYERPFSAVQSILRQKALLRRAPLRRALYQSL